jgi:BirA family transcriptional regulator, biotin operon repressor / biotin---[acetyl-CoA-carboxylase] ligase
MFIGQSIITLPETESTNRFAAELIADANVFEGTVISAFDQNSGIGQRGNVWYSEPGKNLTVSVILKPGFLPVIDQFKLNKAVSLAVADFVATYVNEPVYVKWPNDIYIKDKKIAGILIENQLKNNRIQYSVVGIGININQTVFNADLKMATSLKLLTGSDFDLKCLLSALCENLERRYLQLKSNTNIDKEYLQSLYRYNTLQSFISGKDCFQGKIIGIGAAGKLLIESEKGVIREYDLKEIAFKLD